MKTIVTKIKSRKSFFDGSDTLENGYPWLTFGAIIFLENVLKKDFSVLEFGSGGSTLFFSKKTKAVKSFETNPDWFEKVKQKTTKLKNVEIFYADRKTMSNALKNTKDQSLDIILIDSDPRRSKRLDLANLSKPKLKIGGFLILDNYQKFGLNGFDYSDFEFYTFDEFGYTGKGTRICRKIK